MSEKHDMKGTEMAYFEERIINPEEFKFDFLYDALTILKTALEEQEKSLCNFTMSEEAETQETSNFYWRMCREYNERAKGMLIAYEIMTTRHVTNTTYAIKEEIKYVKQIDEQR